MSILLSELQRFFLRSVSLAWPATFFQRLRVLAVKKFIRAVSDSKASFEGSVASGHGKFVTADMSSVL